MPKRTPPRKPTGILGSLQVGNGEAKYEQRRWPEDKPAIERTALQFALDAANARGRNLYDLIESPRQNGENDFDFTLATTRGAEDLDLMEVVLPLGSGGYSELPTYYDGEQMVVAIQTAVMEKARHYGRPSRPLHLLLYSTDSRLILAPHVVDAAAAVLAGTEHCFSTINYVCGGTEGAGVLEAVHPRVQSSSVTHPGYVVFGDLERFQVHDDGSVSIPIPLPPSGAAARRQQWFERRIWICPVLCGCEIEIVGLWLDPPVYDSNHRRISDGHPAPGSSRSISIVNVCADHISLLVESHIDETHGGVMRGCLHRPAQTAAERLYVALSRFTGQTFRPDTCECQVYQCGDRTAKDSLVSKPHPRLSRRCLAHADDHDHAAAIENNRRKNFVLRHLSMEIGLPLGTVKWSWTTDRVVLMTASGLSEEQRLAVEAWCDASFGPGTVKLA